ncbi:spidroin-1-like [Crassostrea angulata]|uniref:spidroin-1-like n=1 Tax=Magallana angulata TaxID=2784310 RepID=UPI0022B1DFBD|nr:spidroin-1-like [Crassostrea angulata]
MYITHHYVLILSLFPSNPLLLCTITLSIKKPQRASPAVRLRFQCVYKETNTTVSSLQGPVRVKAKHTKMLTFVSLACIVACVFADSTYPKHNGGYFPINGGDYYPKGGCGPYGCGYNGFQGGLVGSGNLGSLGIGNGLVGNFGGLNTRFGGVGGGSAAASAAAAGNAAAAAAAAAAGQNAAAASAAAAGNSAAASAAAASGSGGLIAPFNYYQPGYGYYPGQIYNNIYSSQYYPYHSLYNSQYLSFPNQYYQSLPYYNTPYFGVGGGSAAASAAAAGGNGGAAASAAAASGVNGFNGPFIGGLRPIGGSIRPRKVY